MLMASMRPCLLRCGSGVTQRRLSVGLRAAHADTYNYTNSAPPPAPAADMPVVNTVSLAGVVARKPWFQDFGTSQKAVINIDAKRRNSKQQRNEIKVVAWGELATWVTAHVKEGDAVAVTGELVHNSWQDKTSEQWKSEIVVVADGLQHHALGQAPLAAQQPPQEYSAPGDSPQQAPDAGYMPGYMPPAAPAAPQALTTMMKPNRVFVKMHAVYTQFVQDYYRFSDVGQQFNIQPYTVLNYAITTWEVNHWPLDLGMMAHILDFGVPGDGMMELGYLMDAVAQTFREAGSDPMTHHVAVKVVRARLMASEMAAAIEMGERMRGGPSVTYTQITFAESLYRRGVTVQEVEDALRAVREKLPLPV